MAVPDAYTFYLGAFNATASRKTEMKNAFARDINWVSKVNDKDGNEIDNPVTFQEAFNKEMWRKLKDTCVAGQIALNKDAAEANDDFTDLIA